MIPAHTHVIAIASGKGGVGKSTVTHQLALTLAAKSLRIGLIDADIYGASQMNLFGQSDTLCNVTEKGMIQPVIADGIAYVSISAMMEDDGPVLWRAPMATRLLTDFLTRVEWPTLDYILIDLPPGTGDIQITLAQQAKLTGALIVTTPQRVAYQIAEKALQMFQRVHIPILGIVENMSGYVCGHCGESTPIFSQGGGDTLARRYNTETLGYIPLDPRLIELSDEGKSLLALPADHPTRVEMNRIADRLSLLVKQQLASHEPLNMQIENESVLHLTWPDHSEQRLDAYTLRLLCACAACIDEHTGKPLLNAETVSQDIKLNRLHPVGRYGVRLGFSDHHDTGIYTFEALQKLATVKLAPHLKKKGESIAPALHETYVSDEALAAAVQQLFDERLNPQIAQHKGHIKVVKVTQPKIYVQMSGGCQGCAQSQFTLQTGVKSLLNKHFPSLTEIVDETEHTEGKTPYYS